MGKRVAVVGGGYSGIAAAFSLAESGIPVTLFESSKTLGGRARGFDWKGTRIDNGQHILLGCYRDTLALIEKTCGIADPFLRFPLELSVDEFHLKPFPIFPPFDVLFGLLGAKGISFPEKLNAVRFLSKARSMNLVQDIAVAELLAKEKQQGRLTDFLWQPLCVSALNTPIDAASSKVFLAVLKDGLNGRGSDMLIPRVDLSTLFPSGAAKFIEEKGGEILTSKAVRSIRKSHAGFDLVTDTETLSFSHVVCAVAPYHLPLLLQALPEVAIPRFDYQPICTIYSQYPEDIHLPKKMTGFSKGLCHWLFDRSEISGQPGLIAGVISATRPEPDGLAAKVHEETKNLISDLPDPLWQKVVMEKRATFSCAVNVERPQNETPLQNFHLAGDYTSGPYPATLEAAVRSGLSCARNILKSV